MVDSIEKQTSDLHFKNNKELLKGMADDQSFNPETLKAITAISDAVYSNDEAKLAKLDRGNGEFSNFVDLEFITQNGVVSASLTEDSWKVKGLDGVVYEGDITDYKSLNKTLDSEVMDYEKLERELNSPKISLQEAVFEIQKSYLEKNQLDADNVKNLPLSSLNQVEDFLRETNYNITDYKVLEFDKNPNGVSFDVIDQNKTVASLLLYENGKMDIAQNGSTYALTSDLKEIKETLNRLNEYHLDQNKPELKPIDEVLKSAEKDWTNNELQTFYKVADIQDTKTFGNYNQENTAITLDIYNLEQTKLVNLSSDKNSNEIIMTGEYTKESISLDRNDEYAVNVIEQQIDLEAIQVAEYKATLQQDYSQTLKALEVNYSVEDHQKLSDIESKIDAISPSNQIVFIDTPEQIKSESLTIDSIKTEKPSPTIENQEALIPTSTVQNEVPLKDEVSVNTSTEINKSSPEQAVPTYLSFSEKEGNSIPSDVSAQYVYTPSDSPLKSSKFYEKSNPTGIAFEDKGKALASTRDDQKTINAMISVAKSKKWGEVQVKGSEEFKRKAWIEAAAQGIAVRGYKPTEQDKAALQVRQEQLSKNQIIEVPQREQVKTEIKVNSKPDLQADDEAKKIIARRILENHLKDTKKSPEEQKKILADFDRMVKDPANLQKIATPESKQFKEIERKQGTDMERSR